MNVSSVSSGFVQGDAVWSRLPRPPNGDLIHEVRACKMADQASITSSADVSDFEIPMKGSCRYGFQLMIPYTLTGLLVAAQWALHFSDSAVSIRYSLLQVTTGGAVVGGRSVSLDALLGQVATALGGGTPGEAILFGSIETGANGGDLITRFSPTGVGVSGTVYAGAVGHAWEI